MSLKAYIAKASAQLHTLLHCPSGLLLPVSPCATVLLAHLGPIGLSGHRLSRAGQVNLQGPDVSQARRYSSNGSPPTLESPAGVRSALPA